MDIQRIEDEILSIASIYEDSFERDTPTAWRKQDAPPAFSITILPDDPDLQSLVSIKLHVTYTRTYPKAPATFAVQQPQGLSSTQIQNLNKTLREESLRVAGEEMVLTIAMFASTWLSSNNNVPKSKGKLPTRNISLAAEMIEREKQKEIDRRKRIEMEKTVEANKTSELVERIELAVQQKKETMIRRESERKHITANPDDSIELVDASVETFGDPVDLGDGIPRTSFKLSCVQQVGMATVYLAESSDEEHRVPPLELHRYEFDGPYYTHAQGQAKVSSLFDEITRLIAVRHENLLPIHAAKLTMKQGSIPVLCVLIERAPALSLLELLSNCETLPVLKCRAIFSQVLTALEHLHSQSLMHRVLTVHNVWITKSSHNPTSIVKLGRFWYYSRLLDLHKSNRFGSVRPEQLNALPDPWLPPEVIQSRYQYSRRRDVWYLGVVILQMLGGLNVTTDSPQPSDAIATLDIPFELRNILLSMFEENKKRTPSCTDLLLRISEWEKMPRLSLSLPMNQPTDYATSPQGTVNGHSPRVGFSLRLPTVGKSSSRYREDWEELEFLGKGGFGSVVKARLKHDNRIYAIKKVRLRENDAKILREVNALSRMSHSSIVRYYTTWVETVSNRNHASTSSGSSSSGIFDDDDDDSESDDPFHVSARSLPEISFARSSTFPGLQGSADPSDCSDSGDSSSTEAEATPGKSGALLAGTPPASQILYIQMEYVEKQTLKEAIEEGLTEERVWVLFRQILDALEHIASWGIVHRDIKLGNIFIDAKGDVKVGDFGLASSRSAVTELSDGDEIIGDSSELTTGVGTSLYIAPEVIDRKAGQNHSKADMYSLGIVFFEMNMPPFTTGTERLHVITALRSPNIRFPAAWPVKRTNQRQVIQLLLQHDPDARPTAAELSRNELLPKRMEEESINEALRLLVNPQSRRYDALLRTLFTQPIDAAKVFSYDATTALRDYAPFIPIVRDHIVNAFRMHGAIEDEPPLLMPLTESQEAEKNAAPVFLDRQGDLVMLPKSVVVPLARSAALSGLERIKRFYCGRAYQEAPGQPTSWQQAAFDIISADVTSLASEAEALSVMDEILRSMPGVESQTYDIYISHTSLVDAIFERIPEQRHREVITILDHTKSSISQKRALLLAQGLNRTLIDDIESLLEPVSIDEAPQRWRSRLDSRALLDLDEIRQTLALVHSMGVRRRMWVKPFLMRSHALFGPGIVFEFRGAKRVVVARGGRYDHLIARFTPPSTNSAKRLPIKAIALQVVLEQIAHSLSAHHKTTIQGLLKEKRSYGVFSPRRCDVYVVSFAPTSTAIHHHYQQQSSSSSSSSSEQPTLLEQRMKLTSRLWRNGISADLMYDSDMDKGLEGHLATCLREGILFVIWETRHSTYKIKSVLKGTETEERPHDIIAYLSREIGEQKRVDHQAGGRPTTTSTSTSTTTVTNMASSVGVGLSTESGMAGPKEAGGGGNGQRQGQGQSKIHVILAGDKDLQRKKHKAKIAYHEKAFGMEGELRGEMEGGGVPVIAVDVPSTTLAALAGDNAWINQGDAWRALVAEHGSLQPIGASLRETIQKKKAEQCKYLLLFSVRDDRPFLFRL